MLVRFPVKIGDWVRWQTATGLVIGVVMYVRDQHFYPYGKEYITDRGSVAASDVLEVRG